ncbi:NUDIX hydrolase [Curtobacterium sp. MCLR17_007]|uniref:NUDIX domain-containing protein n=1 Tax=Curtobacterium sp. MCLR17_007 TaxID=2175648 RepID=UPI000DA7E51C|nr:NUDIX domain-containing protein [Curtobacterium sp. MCLR17_007]WIB59921.1 NUDIX hydrolase [Curtobacterium sp. MCLR17_007]
MTDAVTTRDQPLIAIDVVPMSFSAAGLLVATARRQYDPYAGQEALPGVLLHPAERLTDAARRALRTKAGIGPETVRHLAQIGAFDGPERDPRDAAISIAFVAVVAADGPPDAARGADQPHTVWRHPTGAEPSLPFDHDRIIQAALDHARTRLWRDTALTRALLGPRFTTADAARLQTGLTGSAPDPGNLNRSLRTNAALVRSDEPVASASGRRGGRPPVTWTWQG